MLQSTRLGGESRHLGWGSQPPTHGGWGSRDSGWSLASGRGPPALLPLPALLRCSGPLAPTPPLAARPRHSSRGEPDRSLWVTAAPTSAPPVPEPSRAVPGVTHLQDQDPTAGQPAMAPGAPAAPAQTRGPGRQGPGAPRAAARTPQEDFRGDDRVTVPGTQLPLQVVTGREPAAASEAGPRWTPSGRSVGRLAHQPAGSWRRRPRPRGLTRVGAAVVAAAGAHEGQRRQRQRRPQDGPHRSRLAEPSRSWGGQPLPRPDAASGPHDRVCRAGGTRDSPAWPRPAPPVLGSHGQREAAGVRAAGDPGGREPRLGPEAPGWGAPVVAAAIMSLPLPLLRGPAGPPSPSLGGPVTDRLRLLHSRVPEAWAAGGRRSYAPVSSSWLPPVCLTAPPRAGMPSHRNRTRGRGAGGASLVSRDLRCESSAQGPPGPGEQQRPPQGRRPCGLGGAGEQPGSRWRVRPATRLGRPSGRAPLAAPAPSPSHRCRGF